MLQEFNKKNMFPSKASMKPNIKAQKISLVSNHFSINFEKTNFKASEWHISFILKTDLPTYRQDPTFSDETAVALNNRQLIDQIFAENKREIFQKLGPNFYNGHAFYNFRKIDQKEFIFANHFKIVLILRETTNRIELDSLIPCQNSRHKILQLLNSQIKFIFKNMNYVELGFNKKYYDRLQTISFDYQNSTFSVMKGFGAVFEAYESGIKLQLDYSTRIICEDNLWTKIKKELDLGISLDQILHESVNGKSFMTAYGNQKLIVISGADQNKTPLSPFPNPKFKNFQEYFAKMYNIKIKDQNQFLLVQNNRKKVRSETGEVKTIFEKSFFVPELLKAEGIPEKLRSNFQFMKEITSRAIFSPAVRFEKTHEIIDQINENNEKAVKFKINPDGNKIQGYQIDAPKILNDAKNGFVPKDDWMKIKDLAEKKDIEKWVVIYDKFSEQNLSIVLQNMEKVANGFKIGLHRPFISFCVNEKTTADEMIKQIAANKEKPELVFFFVTKRTAGSIYKDAKRRFNNVGVLTQFFTGFNPNKDMAPSQKYTNIILQIQAKLGRNLWYVENDLIDTLVLGADVYHSKNQRSVASVVGQFGKNLKHTYSTVSIQSSKYEEIISSMSNMFLEILERYIKVEKKLPDRVIFYRDGVGQSFIETIMQQEVSSIISVLEQKYTINRPKITVILVTKRISDKFALDVKPLANPPSGTVIESSVVEPDKATFFMISQKVTQGTANPTKYQIVYDEANSKFEHLIKLTRNLTWGYFNWQGPVKVPAPVQYAHKNCYLIGELQDSKVNTSIKKNMYYL